MDEAVDEVPPGTAKGFSEETPLNRVGKVNFDAPLGSSVSSTEAKGPLPEKVGGFPQDETVDEVPPGAAKGFSKENPLKPVCKVNFDAQLDSSAPSKDSKGPLSRIAGGFPMDEAVLDLLPRGTQVVSAEPSGYSAWTITGKVTVILPDGCDKSYFLKCANGSHGRTMLLGEFTSVTTIHSLIPDLVPAPHGWGKYKIPCGTTDRYFFLSDFIEMDVNAPDPDMFARRIAELHTKGTSPNGMFGFPVTTCDGKLPHTVEWESNWAVFFTKLLKGVLKLDTETNGSWPGLEAASRQVFVAVIPRLLGVLQSSEHAIKPSLIHGDLWEGNVGTVMENGETIIYDAGSYYAHNEMELGIWRCEWGQFLRNRIYFERYFLNYPQAEPKEEWEDRNRLYSLKYNLNYSAGHPESVTRQTAYNDMLYLCEKYAPLRDLEAYDPQKDPSVTGARIQVHG